MATSRDETPAVGLEGLDTPCLILDAERLGRNAARMRARCAGLGVTLRPHLKTAKSLDVARVATGGAFGPVTVSTLKEADYFARGGYRDILYAVAIAPAKLRRVDEIQAATGARILLVVDSIPAARALAAAAPGWSPPFDCLIEVDCGERRSGVQPTADALLPIARALVEGGAVLQGVITHAGHSYSSSEPSVVEAIAEDERSTAVTAAGILAEAGFPCPIISVGSTPTVQFAHHLDGVTEARCGIYMFCDLAQLSRNVCAYDDIAVSVLATVIGHNRDA